MTTIDIEKMGRYLGELYFSPENPKPLKELGSTIRQMRIIRSFPPKDRGRDFGVMQKKATVLEERLHHLYLDFRGGKDSKLGIRNLFPVLLARQLSFDLLQLLSSMGLTSFDVAPQPESDIFTPTSLPAERRRLPASR